jgi:hypothetical protein
MMPRQDIWRCINCFTQSSLHQGSCATTSKLTSSQAANNMVEYEAIIFGLSIVLSLGVRQLLVKGDSQLIIKEVKGECNCNDPQLATYLLHAQKIEKRILRSWSCTMFLVQTLQSPIICQQRPPLVFWCLMESLEGDCCDLQSDMPSRAMGVRPAPRSWWSRRS